MRLKERFYRDFAATGRWESFRVRLDTTDLFIRAERDLSAIAMDAVRTIREDLWREIGIVPEFLTSLDPLPLRDECSEAAAMMYLASQRAVVGPMAAVAGAVAELVGRTLAWHSGEVIVENGGDIWVTAEEQVEIAVYANDLYFDGSMRMVIRPEDTPIGICTSSGTIGHSLSFGKADAVTVTARSAALADAIATAACNRVKSREDIDDALSFGMESGASGVLIAFHETLGAIGNIQLAGR